MKSGTGARLHEVGGWRDRRLPRVLDIWQRSFPPREQMPLSWWVDLLNARENSPSSPGDGTRRVLLAVVAPQDDPNEDVCGMAYYEAFACGGERIGWLYYLAVDPRRRGGGIGRDAYRDVAERVQGEDGCGVLFFEVEDPAEVARTQDAAAADLARRRIAWYRRNGARRLSGVRYIQSVGWQSGFEMGLMLHAFAEIAPERAFALVRAALENGAVEQIGPLGLD
uniref:N-acetyltransferase domain-containing protein n=1 Tax=uncultured Armatimonadetes bacterium TaxID=157466 RepID=A0A6J4JE78_9BACT|nr:hypothetical protein AVDCRST_MAG63-3186 [uncultured Armatimonadetes bacterium]